MLSMIDQVRELKVRDSENVALLGSELLRNFRHRLKEEECKFRHRAWHMLQDHMSNSGIVSQSPLFILCVAVCSVAYC